MKTLYKSFLATALLACSLSAQAVPDQLDAEGYPVMYVRGLNGTWDARDQYKMTRTGSTYSIHLDELDGEFKFAGTGWEYNFGGANGLKVEITGSGYYVGAHDGGNYSASHLTDVTVTFDLQKGNPEADATIHFEMPERPVQGLSGTLPVLYINVYGEDGVTLNNEINSKDLPHKDYFSGSYWLDLNGCEWLAAEGAKSIGSADEPLPLEIKARGNYTRIGFAKKPFKLKLGKKQSMLGMTKSKHYAILAHADDWRGYLRNFTGFNLGKRIGLPWTPSQQPVEVVINGDYRGLYFLTESIRVGDDRVMIEELADNVTDAEIVSGGYLVELDNYDEENQIRMEEQTFVGGLTDMLRITWDTPEVYSDLQKRFVTDQFTTMNHYIGTNDNSTWSYLDLDDAVRYYLVEEMISHVEAYHGSTYLFRDRGEGQKWHFSPLWDCGNAFNGPTDGFIYHNAPFGMTWAASMRANDKFNDKLRDTWMWFMTSCYDGLVADIDTYIGHLGKAAEADYTRWHGAPAPSAYPWSTVADNRDLKMRRDEVVNHLTAKINWLREKFGDYTKAGTVAEPARDTTPAAALPEYAQTGVEDIAAEATDTPAEYYNLQGMRVAQPQPGQIYIARRGTSSVKVRF